MANKIYVGQEGAQELYRRVKALSANYATAEQGAKADAAYQKLVDGIPKSDLDSGVQASLGKADTALQEHQDISGKADKVANATSGNFAGLDANGELEDSGIAASDVATSVQNSHSHSNKAVLDATTASYTTEEQTKLNGIESGAEVNLIESVSVAGTVLDIESKSVNVPEAGGTAGAWVKGVVSGEDTARWDNWKHDANITIPLPKDTIEVKGHLFKYVQIGNLLVTTENLDIPLGTVGTNCFWYNDDEDTNRDLGMLYKFSALGSFQYIDYYHSNEFVPTQEVYDCIYAQGWRIWTDRDWDTIIQAHIPSGGVTQDGLKNMCATSGWNGGTQGANTLGLNLPPSGERQWDGTAYSYKGTYFVARTTYTQQTVNRISPTVSIIGVGNLNTGASIRLVKDVTA
jgi:uncharacterized protein (TIGR02145 family)